MFLSSTIIIKHVFGKCITLCSFTAIQAHVVMVERLGDWMRYTINLLGMYKKDPRQTRRGETYVWVRYRDFKCKCPKLRKGRKYLIIGRHRKKYKRPGYVADRKTIVIRWRDRWQRRLRRFMRHERRGNCNSSGRKKRNRNWSLIEHSVFTENSSVVILQEWMGGENVQIIKGWMWVECKWLRMR